MSFKSRNLVAQLFESRFKGKEAIRKILDNPVDPKRSTLSSSRKRRRGNYVKGVHKGNFFRIRLPSSGKKLPNLPKLPPTQPMLKAPTGLPPAQTAEATEAILQSHAAGGAVSAEMIAKRGPYGDFLRRLGQWFQDNWTVLVLNCGSFCSLMGFTRSDMLELRALSMTGSIASAIYLIGQQRILWLSVGWSSLFASVNAFKIFGIYQERNFEVHMTKEQENIYIEYFLPHGITPKQFERIEAKATKYKLKKGAHLVRKGDKLEYVYLILNGKTKAHILGRHITALTKGDDTVSFDNATAGNSESQNSPQVKSGAWIGEMAFMDYYWDQEQRRTNKNAPQNYSGGTSFYTIMAVEDCDILRWSHSEMSELMSTSNDMRSALTRAMTSALVSKVVQMSVSKTKQMPTWSTWLADWAHNAGAAVTVQRVAEGPLSAANGIKDEYGNYVDEGNEEKDASSKGNVSLASSLAGEEEISNETNLSENNPVDDVVELVEEAADIQDMNPEEELEGEKGMILPNSEDDAVESQPVPNEEDVNNTNEEEEGTYDQVEVWLPIIEVQFVCDHDFRPLSGNETDYMLKIYQNLYNQLLPDEVTATLSSLHHLERFSSMSDITPTKWYYSDCNMTSPQLLASLKVKGKGTLSHSDAPTLELGMNEVHEAMNEPSIKEFMIHNVCTNMTDFRAYVESSQHHHQQNLYYTSHSPAGPPTMTFEHVEHSLLLLCGGEDLVYYDEGPPDGGFLFFGFFAGFLMVSMIATELQKYDQRPHPLGGRRREYDGVATHQELEMV